MTFWTFADAHPVAVTVCVCWVASLATINLAMWLQAGPSKPKEKP